ncbi:MAG: 2'-deoxycytidine 5'-triphosphate deaminase [Nanoarchaeota archaeon]|nr:2'-deoxycytidine 5'-triphosphate deaminase [Nanoarchaeota archaeon]
MILSHGKLVGLVKAQNLIENMPESELTKEGGVAFDLRLGEIYEFAGEGFLGINERKTPDTKLIAKYEESKTSKVVLEPDKYYIVKTLEKVNCPHDLASTIISRSTLYRSGILLLGGLVDPGWNGEMTFGMINKSGQAFTIELGARIANILFHRVDGKTKEYKGVYNGGYAGAENLTGK